MDLIATVYQAILAPPRASWGQSTGTNEQSLTIGPNNKRSAVIQSHDIVGEFPCPAKSGTGYDSSEKPLLLDVLCSESESSRGRSGHNTESRPIPRRCACPCSRAVESSGNVRSPPVRRIKGGLYSSSDTRGYKSACGGYKLCIARFETRENSAWRGDRLVDINAEFRYPKLIRCKS